MPDYEAPRTGREFKMMFHSFKDRVSAVLSGPRRVKQEEIQTAVV